MIRNTKKPAVPYVSFEGESVDNKRAMILGKNDRNELDLDCQGKRISLPPYFLIPDHPRGDNQKVVVLDGDNKGKLYKTIKGRNYPPSFELSPIQRRKRSAELSMTYTSLALVDS